MASLIPVKDPVTGAVTYVSETAGATPAATTPTGRPGYDYDPYDTPDERAEGMFVGAFIGKFTGERDGFCSSYREWHIFVRGLYAGFSAKILGDVPECPPLWQDEAQYFEGAAMVANVAKCNIPGVVATIIAGIGYIQIVAGV